MPVITSVATVAVVIALVNVAKEFGVSGKWATLVSVVLGVVLGVVEYAFTNTFTSEGFYQSFATGLLIGLTAAGVYDVSRNMGGGSDQ